MATETIPAKDGNKKITFQKGGLHASTNTPPNDKIPKSKVMAALAGKYGEKAKKQANFMMNVLKGK